MSRRYSPGFSAAELLITLFIAAIFIFAAFQLYGVMTNDAAMVRNKANANNIVYDNLRKISSQKQQPCVARSTAAGNLNPGVTLPASPKLPDPVTITGAIDCPFSATQPKVSRITVTITYGKDNPQEQVSHVIYAY